MNNFKCVSISVFSLLLYSCSGADYSSIESGKKELINNEKKFSDLASRVGFFNAFMKYAADDIVKLGDGRFPIVGKKELEKSFDGKPGTKSLTWKAVFADISESGEIGYTWGNWKYTGKDSTLFGNYYTVWKKQKNGEWKVTLDGGNSTPAPPGLNN